MKHANVTTQGITINDLNEIISSQRGKASVMQAYFFGAKGALLNATVQYSKMTSLVNQMKSQGRDFEADRLQNSTRFLYAQEKANTLAKKTAAIHSKCDEMPVEFIPQIARGSSQKQIEQKASFARVSVDQVKILELNAATRAYNDQLEAASLAEALFWGANINEPTTELNADGDETIFPVDACDTIRLNPQTALSALNRQRDWLLSWKVADMAELGILAADIETIEAHCEKYDNANERQGDESKTLDGEVTADADTNNRYEQNNLTQRKQAAA
jgi:hypothetical protein